MSEERERLYKFEAWITREGKVIVEEDVGPENSKFFNSNPLELIWAMNRVVNELSGTATSISRANGEGLALIAKNMVRLQVKKQKFQNSNENDNEDDNEDEDDKDNKPSSSAFKEFLEGLQKMMKE